MKQFLRMLLAACIIAFAVLITAVSCGKTPDAGGGNNNSGGGVDPNAGPGSIVITNINANLVKVSQETNILLKLSGWSGNDIGGGTANHFGNLVDSMPATSKKKAFEFINDKAKEGLVLVGKGNANNPVDITTLAVATFAGNAASDDDGIHVVPAATATANRLAGLNFFSVFANTNNPTSTAAAAANVEPFAFSVVTTTIFPSQPIFYCVATAPGITAAVVATDKLVGAHKADCFVTSRNVFTSGTKRTRWFGAADPFKREIQVAVSAIRTDGKTIGDLMLGANAAAKLANFNDGINAIEMAGLLAASGHGMPPFKKFNIKVVNDADFAAVP